MTRFNADDFIVDPIEVVIDGKTYTLSHVDSNMIAAITDSLAGEKPSVNKCVAVMLGVPEETFNNVDTRRMRAVNKFLTKEIFKEIDLGNLTAGEPKL